MALAVANEQQKTIKQNFILFQPVGGTSRPRYQKLKLVWPDDLGKKSPNVIKILPKLEPHLVLTKWQGSFILFLGFWALVVAHTASRSDRNNSRVTKFWFQKVFILPKNGWAGSENDPKMCLKNGLFQIPLLKKLLLIKIHHFEASPNIAQNVDKFLGSFWQKKMRQRLFKIAELCPIWWHCSKLLIFPGTRSSFNSNWIFFSKMLKSKCSYFEWAKLDYKIFVMLKILSLLGYNNNNY